MQALELKNELSGLSKAEGFEKTHTLISSEREDREGVVTNAQTILEIAKVFDELRPSSSELPDTVENEDDRIVRLANTITRSYETNHRLSDLANGLR